MKRLVLLVGILAILGALIAIQSATTPTITSPTITPSIITVGTTTMVTITVPISDPTLTAGSVNLISLGPSGTQSTILGQLHDDGKSGDAVANDNIFTIQYPFNPSSAGQLQLEVSAAFRGQLKRIISPIVTINIWGLLADQTSGFQVLYPSNLYNVTSNTPPGFFMLSSSPMGVNTGDTGPDASLSATGFNISIIVSQYNVTSFDLSQWLSEEFPGETVGAITPVTIGGQPGYEFQFTEGEGSGEPMAVIDYEGTTYQIIYSPSSGSGPAGEQAGLSAFALVLQNLSFTR